MREAQDLTVFLPVIGFETLRQPCKKLWNCKGLQGLNRGLNFKNRFKTALRRHIQKILMRIKKTCLNVSKFYRG